jgi:KRAB domain-containing zinc finger protein
VSALPVVHKGGKKGLTYTFAAGQSKPFKCGSCDYSTNSISRLRRHQNGKHLQLKPFRCEVCSRMFGRKSHLINHSFIHTGEKPFKCHLCDYRCSRKSHLNRHLEAMHSDQIESD